MRASFAGCFPARNCEEKTALEDGPTEQSVPPDSASGEELLTQHLEKGGPKDHFAVYLVLEETPFSFGRE